MVLAVNAEAYTSAVNAAILSGLSLRRMMFSSSAIFVPAHGITECPDRRVPPDRSRLPPGSVAHIDVRDRSEFAANQFERLLGTAM